MRTLPVWALQVRQEPTRVADAVREAIRDRNPMPASPADVGRGGLFRGCNPIFRVAEPLRFIGIFRSPGDAATTVLLIPRSPDRVPPDRLRTTFRTRL